MNRFVWFWGGCNLSWVWYFNSHLIGYFKNYNQGVPEMERKGIWTWETRNAGSTPTLLWTSYVSFNISHLSNDIRPHFPHLPNNVVDNTIWEVSLCFHILQFKNKFFGEKVFTSMECLYACLPREAGPLAWALFHINSAGYSEHHFFWFAFKIYLVKGTQDT